MFVYVWRLWPYLPQSVDSTGISDMFIPTEDTHITSNMCTGVHISRGYTYHCDIDTEIGGLGETLGSVSSRGCLDAPAILPISRLGARA